MNNTKVGINLRERKQMIHEIEPHIFCNDFKNKKATENDFILIYDGNTVLLGEKDGEIVIPTFCDFSDTYTDIKDQAQFVFTIDGDDYYLLNAYKKHEHTNEKHEHANEKYEHGIEKHEHVNEKHEYAIEKYAYAFEKHANDRYAYVNTAEYRYKTPMWKVYACAVGEQLNRWYDANKFCSRCGHVVTHHEHERALQCTNCKRVIYPTISPVVIVAVVDGDRILMTKNTRGGYKRYALVAGYTEVGESIEETVKREVLEEVGLHVKNIRYYKSQPWPFSDTLLMGFFADLDGSDHIVLQEEELTEATWFIRDEIPRNDLKISLTNEMIELFRSGK